MGTKKKIIKIKKGKVRGKDDYRKRKKETPNNVVQPDPIRDVMQSNITERRQYNPGNKAK